MRKVMVVDDDRDFLDEMKVMLKSSGYNTVLLANGSNAVKEVSKYKPDVLLLDIKMDEVSGFKIADELRRIPELKNIPIIGVTGFYTEKEHRLFMKMCGIKKIIIKPFQPLDIIAAIEKALAGEFK